MRALLLSCLLLSCVPAVAAEPGPYPPDPSYERIFSDMAAARRQAIDESKLLMYVMGANWCHDSTDFAERTAQGEFAELIEQRYVPLFINVGELEYVREIITRYDEPVIYGTPTVLVVEPGTDALLNRDRLSYWRDASVIDMADTVAYFEAYRPGQQPPAQAHSSAVLAAALADIDAFEQRQAERIYAAYAELSVLIREADDGEYSDEFQRKWKNLAQMRGSITRDLQALRASAREQDARGARDIQLDYPEYALFIDQR